jgi:hypothetical protein
MKEIKTIEDFYSFLKKYSTQTRRFIFRGHSSTDHILIPSIGRVTQAETDSLFDKREERKMLNAFVNKAYPYLKKRFTLIESMTIAQHHGLPTRLLDWTWNPLIAFFFSIGPDEYAEQDGILFVTDVHKYTLIRLDHLNKTSVFEPFSIKDIALYEPKHVNLRITAQSALFSVHPRPNKPIADDRIEEIILSAKVKAELGLILETWGIHSGNLFPGLDGEASHIKWLYTF